MQAKGSRTVLLAMAKKGMTKLKSLLKRAIATLDLDEAQRSMAEEGLLPLITKIPKALLKLEELGDIVTEIKSSVTLAKDPDETIDAVLKLARKAFGTPAVQAYLKPYALFLTDCIRTPLEQMAASEAMMERIDGLSTSLAAHIAKHGVKRFWLSWGDILAFVADPATVENGLECLEQLLTDDGGSEFEVEMDHRGDDPFSDVDTSESDEDGGIRLLPLESGPMESGPELDDQAKDVNAQREMDERIAHLFLRYDVDGSGTITSEDDLEMLHTNVLFALAMPTDVQKFETLRIAADITNQPMGLTEFTGLFRSVHGLAASSPNEEVTGDVAQTENERRLTEEIRRLTDENRRLREEMSARQNSFA